MQQDLEEARIVGRCVGRTAHDSGGGHRIVRRRRIDHDRGAGSFDDGHSVDVGTGHYGHHCRHHYNARSDIHD